MQIRVMSVYYYLLSRLVGLNLVLYDLSRTKMGASGHGTGAKYTV